MAKQQLYEAEADVEARNWEKREIRIFLFMRSIKNFNVNDFSYTRQVDGLISLRDKNQLVWRIGIEKKALPRSSCKKFPRH